MNTILFVEDDVFIAEIYIKKFVAEGFAVDNAVTGREVLKRIQEKSYDLILLDLVLPEMGGMEVLRELREKPQEYPGEYKVIVSSNLSSPEDRTQAIKAGADGFISKNDFTPSKVVKEVQRYLKQFSEQKKHAERSTHSSESNATPPAIPQPATRRSILLIEDEKVFAEMFGKRLMDEGYGVTVLENGQTAYDVAIQHPFDLIITDVILPGLDGRVLIEKLRTQESTADIPIFLLSASLVERDIDDIRKTGKVNQAFLKTKITPSELVEAVNAYFQESKS